MKLTEKNFFQFARRYFIKDGFDAVLTMLGVVMGAFVSRINEPRVVLFVGFTTCVAMGVSGVWGTFLTERAERKKRLNELEKSMLTSLENSVHSEGHLKESFLLGVVDGLPPLLAAVFVLSPFLASMYGLTSVSNAYYYSFALMAFGLFSLGAFLGKISKRGFLRSGFVMLLAGVVAALLNLALGSLG
jgi:predicted membrane protein (TIGR00267 family)